MKLFTTTLTIICLSYLGGISQDIEWRTYLGATYYQGDLTPFRSKYSYSQGHIAYGTSVGIVATRYLSFHTRFLKGQLSGKDSEAADESRRLRNLSFKSDIYEFGVVSEFSFNSVLKFLNKYGINLYASLGVNMLHFNPEAYINGEWIKLRPLGTEGQGLQNQKSKYSLTTVSIPFGVGLRFNTGPSVGFGLEVLPRRTYTDYLDDVSGNYPDYDALVAQNGQLSADLSYRGDEVGASGGFPVEGTLRGDPNDNDWYLYAGMYISVKFGKSTLPVVPIDLD